MAKENKEESAIRSEGAELFVQSILMLEYGLIASQVSRNMPGYDILVFNPKTRKQCTVQVKFRAAKNADGFRFSNCDFDFCVLVCGNIGSIGSKDKIKHSQTEFYIFDKADIERNLVKGSAVTGAIFPRPNNKSMIDKCKINLNNWIKIVECLQ